MDRLILWLAEGLGSGRLPKGPGTWGSLVGLGWTWLLLWPGSPWLFFVGSLAGVLVAVWVCGRAETILGRHDPGSVVLDEIVALPLCFGGAIVAHTLRQGFPGTMDIMNTLSWWGVALVFIAFRCFDILKPWPVNQAQELPGGWGVVADDLLAALWVNAVTVPLFLG